MRSIRPSLVFSVGDRAGEIARRVQSLTAGQLRELKTVLAFVNLSPDGRIVWRRNGDEEHELGVLRDLSGDQDPRVFAANFQALAEHADALERILKDLTRHVRRKEELARIQAEFGLSDSNRSFVYLLADSFGPVASTFPLALMKLVQERGLGVGRRVPVAFNVFLFLPELFEDGRNEEALLRTHATLSELESFLSQELPPGRQAISWRIWVIGSVDRTGGVVKNFESVVMPTAQFLGRYIDGLLDRDESWIELDRSVNSRRTFLSSFGQANLFFPRDHLERCALLLGQRRLSEHVLPPDRTADFGEASGEVQAWIREMKLSKLTALLQEPEGGRLIYRAPSQPEISAADLEVTRFEQGVQASAVANPEWGIAVQRAGRTKLESFRDAFLEKTDAVVDSPRGLEGARLFAENLAGVGTGLTEVTVGLEILNLERLILDLQDYFAREAGVAGRPQRLIELERIIPGKIEAIERLSAKASGEKERIAQLKARSAASHEADKTAGKPAETAAEMAETAEEPGETADTAEILDETGRETLDDAANGEAAEAKVAPAPRPSATPAEDAEAVPEPSYQLGEVSAAETISAAEQRLENNLKDRTTLEKELAELKEEESSERQKIAESRRLACDPSRRDLLLRQFQEKERAAREAEKAELSKAVGERVQSREGLRQAAAALRRTVLRFLVLLPAIAVIVIFLIYALLEQKLPGDPSWEWPLNWLGWTLVAAFFAGFLFVLRGWLDYLKARTRNREALRAVTLSAESMWRGHVRELRKRFDFLIHAEAITVLERLQEEVRAEESRLSDLRDFLERYAEQANQQWSDATLEDSLYARAVLGPESARSLIENSREINYSIRETLDRLTLSQISSAVRGNHELDAVPPPIAQAEERFGSETREILGKLTLTTALEQDFASRPGDLSNLWLSAQGAASAWIMVDGEPPPGTLKKLVFYPKELSRTLLEECLKKYVLDEEKIDWVSSDDADHLSICEMYVGFPSHLITEICRPHRSFEKRARERSVVPETKLLSRAPSDAEITVTEFDAYALLRAALWYFKGDRPSPGVGTTPGELVNYFRKAEFLPQETTDELLEQVRDLSAEEQTVRLRSFVDQLRGTDRSQATKIFGDLLRHPDG